MPSQLPDTKDIPWADARDTDIVIPILGPIGSGKSSFLNKYLEAIGDSRRLEVGKNREQPCTSQLEFIVIEGRANLPHPLVNRRIVLVDTPGFNDILASDFKTLVRIRKWFKAS
ncbi:hypothetical protein FA13DRAFT_540128 [Coprinellus micaceus]|uniref:Uncharacterized protein n=1 Tax=Coprinellus micaceus TaxID=71717 RepID=A0A4Y7SB05_COPMI|nr:hypothetical protein FA13DRAFT_540128 [Coprinellus micaceus]